MDLLTTRKGTALALLPANTTPIIHIVVNSFVLTNFTSVQWRVFISGSRMLRLSFLDPFASGGHARER